MKLFSRTRFISDDSPKAILELAEDIQFLWQSEPLQAVYARRSQFKVHTYLFIYKYSRTYGCLDVRICLLLNHRTNKKIVQ